MTLGFILAGWHALSATHPLIIKSPAHDLSPLEETDSFSELNQAVDVILCWARYDRAEGKKASKLMSELKLFRLFDSQRG